MSCVLGVRRSDDELAAVEVYVPLLQRQELATAAAGFQRADDEAVQSGTPLPRREEPPIFVLRQATFALGHLLLADI